MLIVAVVGLGLPSMYSMVVDAPARQMSLAVSIILGIVYVLSLIYTLVTHKHLFVVERQAPEENHDRWSEKAAIVVLLISSLRSGGSRTRWRKPNATVRVRPPQPCLILAQAAFAGKARPTRRPRSSSG